MKYYVITDLGYDGMMMEEFEEETKALERYLEMNKDVPTLYEGVGLLQGKFIKINRLLDFGVTNE